MVEVTKSNFEELFPLIENAVKKSSFIAVDCEFTGLDLGATNEASLFDSMESRYQKLKATASAFLPCQVGLSTFTKDGDENKYLVETYVFYIRPHLCGSIDRRFMLQASCLDFLSRYDFDFNKFIKEGIPYLNEIEEAEVRKKVEENTIGHNHIKSISMEKLRKFDFLINQFLVTSKHNFSFKRARPGKYQTTNRLVLDSEPFCHEYFLIKELRGKYPSLKVYSENGKIIVEKGTSNENNELLTKCEKEKERLIDYFIGFSKVFKLLRSCNKPIVGHNLLKDLLLLFHNCYKPLPNSYKEFKQELHSIFPIIFDTRHIWMNLKKFYDLKQVSLRSGLFELFEMFKNPTDGLTALFSPEVIHTNCDKYYSEEFPHESGYDSYVTGWVFIKICHVLAFNKITNPIFVQPQSLKQHLKAVLPFQNKINIARSWIRYIDLCGDDPKPTEIKLLYMQYRNKRKQLFPNELSRIFNKYGPIEFKLSWSKRGAILAVGNYRCYKDVLKDFSSHPDFEVSKYSVIKHSPMINTGLWLLALGVGTLSAIQVVKFYSKS